MVRRESIRLFVAESPLFIYEDDLLISAFVKMKKLEASFLTVVKKDLTIRGILNKKDVFEALKEFPENKQKNIRDFTQDNKKSLILYPRSTTFEAVSTMKTLKKKAMPVANNPWEKKFIGILWLSDVDEHCKALAL